MRISAPKKLDTCAIFVSLFVFFSFNPFFLWGFGFSLQLKLLFDVVFFGLFFYTFLLFGINKKIVYIFIPLILWCCLRFLWGLEYVYFYELSKILIKITLLLSLPFVILDSSFRYFRLIVIFFAVSTIFSSLLILFFGSAIFEFVLNNPYDIKVLNNQNYVGYFFGSYLDSFRSCSSGLCLVRNNGPLDEPGYWGTFLGLYFAARRLHVSSREFKIIVAAGFCTFSLAFILIFLMSILLNNRRSLAKVVFFTSFILVLIGMVSSEYLEAFSIGRFTFQALFFERGADILVDKIINADIEQFLFGHGFGLGHSIAYGSSSWLLYLYDGGVFLILTTFLFYCFLYLIYARNKVSLLLLPIMFASFLQRPDIIWVGFIYLFLMSRVAQPELTSIKNSVLYTKNTNV